MSSPSNDYGHNHHLAMSSVVMIVVASAAILSTLLSWRKQDQLQKHCNILEEKLQEALEKETKRIKNTEKKSDPSTKPSSGGAHHQNPPPSAVLRQILEDDNIKNNNDMKLSVQPIGMVRSIYRLCVGTPRQGLLVPNARGSIELMQLGDSSPIDSVSGLEAYSHIWIVFIFHLNNNNNNNNAQQQHQKSPSSKTKPKKRDRVKSKISPPALGGEKVGVFATRSPHRFNPIGITLCKLDGIVVLGNNNNGNTNNNNIPTVRLDVSGLDLVDGTPVLDIKPYVPVYDSVSSLLEQEVRLPHWVSGGLATKRTVTITDQAQEELKQLLEQDPQALQFYGPHRGEKSIQETTIYVLECIQQVLSIDVRSSYQTKKVRQGKSQAERAVRLREVVGSNGESTSSAKNNNENNLCTQQLDNLLIHFKVQPVVDRQWDPSINSGAEDKLVVVAIERIKGGG